MRLLPLLLIMLSFTAFSQNSKKELKNITSVEDAEVFLESNPKNKGKIMVFNEVKHQTPLAQSILKKHKGNTYTKETSTGKVHYKVLDRYKTPHYRVSIILFDATKMPLEDINTLRKSIIKKYTQGASFDYMAQKYSMDITANQGGDTGWVAIGDGNEDFEKLLLEYRHNIGEPFKLDLPDLNYYYVVLKTHNVEDFTEVKVLKYNEDL